MDTNPNRPGYVNITLCTDDGEETVHELPARFQVCPRCEGHGTHLNPSIGEHAYTMEEFQREFDEEEAEQYFTRGGMYDVTCQECGGQRVVQVVDETRLTKEQKEVHRRWQASEAEERAYEAEWRREIQREEMMMGGGY